VAKSSNCDKWLYVLKNMSEMEALPTYLWKTIFEKVFQIAEYSNLTKEEQEMYNASIKQKWDEQSRWETATNEGMEKGLLLGIEQEREKAEADKLRFALNFKKEGVPIGKIAKILSLSPEEIERL